MDYCVITFTSTHGAIYAQQVLKDVAPFVIMPVLREISTGCGISVRFAPENLEDVRNAMAACNLIPGEFAFYGVLGQGHDLAVESLNV